LEKPPAGRFQAGGQRASPARAASMLCGLSLSPGLLIGARFVQGVGGALSSVVALGMIVTMFPEPRDQARAFSVYSFVASAGGSIGLLAGGVLTQVINWHWIFFINVPIGIAAAVLSVRLLEPDPGIGLGEGADVVGAFFVTAALMLGVYTIVGTAQYGWNSPHTIGLGALSILLLAGFVLRQATAANPLLPLRVFGSRNVSGANLIQFLVVASLLGFFFLSSLYLQRVLGLNPLQIGFAFLPVALSMGVLSLGWSARLTTRFGPRTVLLPALMLASAGLALLMRAPVHSAYLVDLLPAMVLVGVGMGLAFPALTMLAMSGATESDSGLASGLINTTAQVGGALGLSILATVATSRTGSLLAGGESLASALTGGYRLVFTISAGLIVAGIALVAVVLQPEASLPGVLTESRQEAEGEEAA
jgi:MFS family permease